MEALEIKNLSEFAITEIKKFAENHKDETFYGFSIDASSLCLNSIEEFNKTLEAYKSSNKTKDYTLEENIESLKLNIGDWKYQGFADFEEEEEFDEDAYEEYYDMDDDEKEDSVYGKAMHQIIENLKTSDAFDKLNKTDNFFITRTEHSY